MTNIIRITNKKNKKYYIVYLTFLLTFIIMIACYCYINNVYKYTVKNRLQNRVLNVMNYKNIKGLEKKISNISHIKAFYHGYTNIVMFSDDNQKYLFNYYNYKVDLLDGKETTELTGNNIIIPDSLNYKNNKLTAYLNGEKYDFNIIGIYNSKTVGSNDIFASETFMKNNSVDYNENYWNVIVDDYDNLNQVIKRLQKIKLDAALKDDTGIKNINIYKLCLNMFSFGELFLLIFSIYIMLIIIKDIINSNNKDIAILKTCGFHNSTILNIIINNLLKVSLKIITIVTPITLLFYYLLFILNKPLFQYLSLIDIIKAIIISYGIFLLTIFFVPISNYKKIKKITPISLFKI